MCYHGAAEGPVDAMEELFCCRLQLSGGAVDPWTINEYKVPLTNTSVTTLEIVDNNFEWKDCCRPAKIDRS